MHLKKEKLAALCRECGPHLHVPQGIDAAQLLWAFAGRESSFGARSIPLHEAAYCYAGKYYCWERRFGTSRLRGSIGAIVLWAVATPFL
jgi:hypothetical protein